MAAPWPTQATGTPRCWTHRSAEARTAALAEAAELAAKDSTPTGPAKFMHKDLSLVLEAAGNAGAAAPLASAGVDLYAQLVAQGLGDLDLAVVRQAIANLARL
ncbi:NAD-binding protein [Pseudarthrobacter enclensis]|uniref:NAD-binding protein n=1 Tax=Pseudarthrobacter enclensis TaxID=993070 RepID=UPI0040392947